MRQLSYPAARLVAPAIQAHFGQQVAAARQRGENPPTEPAASIIESLLEAAFWASLRREEGHSPKISLAFLSPDQAEMPLRFDHPLPLTPTQLVKLSPGVERAGIHLGVWHGGEILYIWGTTLQIPPYCLVVDVSEPGLMVIKHRRMHGFGKFNNVAVLSGDQIKVVDETSTSLPDCPGLLKSFINLTENDNTSAHVLIQLAVSMRAHGHGGILLIVPSGSDAWRGSIVHPITYQVDPPHCGIATLLQEAEENRAEALWLSRMQHEITSLAGLTAIDGATIITDQLALLAFGTKITRAFTSVAIEELLVSEPIVGGSASRTHPGKLGGTRHLSAAQFVHDQRDALALVASQDGQFTIFSWSACEGVVQAHRIETLLL